MKELLNEMIDAIERGGQEADADFQIGFEEGEYSLRPEDEDEDEDEDEEEPLLHPLRF